MAKYDCVITDRHHKVLYGASFEEEESAIDFMQRCKDKDSRTYFFTIEKISQNEDGSVACEKIFNDATYLGTTKGENA